jgi:hypothetical protein
MVMDVSFTAGILSLPVYGPQYSRLFIDRCAVFR